MDEQNLIFFPKICAVCDETEDVKLFKGLWLCHFCLDNLRLTSPHLFAQNSMLNT